MQPKDLLEYLQEGDRTMEDLKSAAESKNATNPTRPEWVPVPSTSSTIFIDDLGSAQERAGARTMAALLAAQNMYRATYIPSQLGNMVASDFGRLGGL